MAAHRRGDRRGHAWRRRRFDEARELFARWRLADASRTTSSPCLRTTGSTTSIHPPESTPIGLDVFTYEQTVMMRYPGRSHPYACARIVRGAGPASTRPYSDARTSSGCAARAHRAHARATAARERLWELLHDATTTCRARRAHRQPGRAAGARRARRPSTCSGWQVAADANLAGQMYPGPEPLSGQQRAARGASASTRRCCAPTRSSTPRGKAQPRLVRADRRRRRGRLRRAAQRVRADEGDDRGGRRGRALRGPARRRRRSAATWAARCSCRPAQFIRTLVAARLAADVLDVPTRARRAHRRATAPSCSRATSTSATARSSPGERTPEGFFHIDGGLDAAIARGLAYAPVRRPALVRDVDAGPRRGAAVRRRRSTRSSRASCSRTTARRRSTGRRTSTTRPSPSSSASSARWATSSSSSRWPASTR